MPRRPAAHSAWQQPVITGHVGGGLCEIGVPQPVAAHDLCVFDIDVAVMGLVEGATQGSSVSDVAENAEVVFLSLPMLASCNAECHAVVRTSSPSLSRSLAAQAVEQDYLE